MTLKKLKPVTPSSRNTILNIFKKKKGKKLKQKLKGLSKKRNGRNNSGKKTLFNKGGGHKQSYRKVNFYSFKGPSIVEEFEYDPIRNSILARLFSITDKEHFFVLATQNLRIGYVLKPEKFKDLKLGNRICLNDAPIGSVVHSLGSKTQPKKAIYQRAAGTFAQLVHKNKKFCVVKLSSGVIKHLLTTTSATIGEVSNSEYCYKQIGKAGRNRWLGNRSRVRGVAMNPIDHPHGGGEGRTSGGRPSVSPWAKPAHGKKTIKRKK